MPPRGNKKPTSLGKRPQRAASPELPQPHKTPRRRSPSPRTLPFTEQETQYTGDVGAAAFSRQESGFSDDNESELSHAISGLATPTDLQRTNNDSREAVDGGEEGSEGSPIRFDFSWVDFSRTELRGYRKPLQEANLHHAVWYHGVPLEVRDVSIPQRWWLCKRCFLAGSVRKYKVKDSLGAVKRHLLQHHHGALKEPKEDWRENVISWLQKMKLNPANPHHQEAIEKLLTEFNPKEFHASIRRWFICSRIPFQRIEDSRFLPTYVTLHPLVKSRKIAPCRKTLRRQIMHDLQIHKDEIRRRLSNAAGKVHIAVDIWTARNNKAFNGIVAHWVEDGQNYSCLLALSPLYEQHRGLNIGIDIIGVLEDYNIIQKLGYLTTDNASPNNTAMDVLEEELHKRGHRFNPEWRRIRCMGHILNLIARALLYGHDVDIVELRTQLLHDQAPDEEAAVWDGCGVVGRLHNIVKWVYSSPQRHERWLNCQKRTGFRSAHQPRALKLIQNNDTRWNSTYSIITRAIELQSELNTFLLQEAAVYHGEHGSYRRETQDSMSRAIFKRKIPPEDWRELEDLVRILEPIHEATKMLEGQPGSGDFCNIGFVIPTFEYIMKQFEDLVEAHTDEPLMQQSLNSAWEKANKYYTLLDSTPAYVAAIVLDHRRRWSFFENNWGADHPEWVEESHRVVRELWVSEYKFLPLPELSETERVPETILSTRLSPLPRPQSNFKSYITSGITKSRKQPRAAIPYDEYDKWCSEEVEDEDLELSPFIYWSKRSIQETFPRLARMALDILSIPPMSSSAERIFSLAGVLLRDRRARLKEDVVEASELLADWDNHGLIEIGSIDILSSPTDDEESESCREDDDEQENDSAHGSGPGIDTNDTQLHHAYFGR